MTQITRKEIEEGMLLFCRSGSHAYGLNTEASDLDYKGICIAPKRFYVTLDTFEQKDKGWTEETFIDTKYPQLDNSDSVVYEVRRYLRLLLAQNPNILEMLWQEPDDYIYLNNTGRLLIENKHRLISRKIAGAFLNYARAQIKKMETHRKWLLNPPTKRPEWEDYGLTVPNMTNTQIEAFIEYLYLLVKDRIEYYQQSNDLYEILYNQVDWKSVLKQSVLPEGCFTMTQNITGANEDYLQLLRISQQYRADLKRWNNYQDWLVNRNPKRSEIERACGYDGKNASHCVRLMAMAIEAMKTGEIIVNRKNAGDVEFLLNIKYGRISYEELNQIVNDLFSKADRIMKEGCILPDRVEYDTINELCERIIHGN